MTMIPTIYRRLSRARAGNLACQLLSAYCLLSCLLVSPGRTADQLDIGAIQLLHNTPTTYQMRDWRTVATNFDSLAFDTTASGQFLPLITIDDTPQSPLLETSFGLPAYVGETRTFGETGEPVHEGISSLAAVLGGTLVGVDKTAGPHNWVSMTREYYRGSGGTNLVLNNPFAQSGQSAWYELYPNLLFYSIADRYPSETYLAPLIDAIDDEIYDAVNVLTDSGTNANFNYTAYNFVTEQPVYNGVWREPDMGLGMAWLQHAAYFRNKSIDVQRANEHLTAVDWSLGYYENATSNPDYEVLMPFGAYTAARMNAEHGRNFDIQKLVDWVFTRSDARPTKIMISGEQWGGQDVGGLMGFTVPNTGSDVRGYAFSMNTFATALPMIPLVRYEDRYSRSMGKWMLNAASAARLYYANAHTAQNQTSASWTGDPQSAVAYEGLRHHWYGANDSEELIAGGDPLTFGWGPQTDFGIYGSALSGVFGSIIRPTNVEKVLQLDLLATDSFRDAAYPTYLYYNPLTTSADVQIDLGTGQFDLYDAAANRFLARNVTGLTTFRVPSDDAVQLVLAPAGGTATIEGRRLLVDSVVVDYNATLLPENLVQNPYVDAAHATNPNRPAFWHYSSNATWSDDEALSPSHSLGLADANANGSEEWRSYATKIPAGEDREVKVRWFWKYDIALGDEFRGQLRFSPDNVVGLDLTNPSQEFSFFASGGSDGFEMFETVLSIPDDIRSFDLIFVTGGQNSALGEMFIDDISLAILPNLQAADFDADGFVDQADLAIWEQAFGHSAAGDADHDGDTDGRDFLTWQQQLSSGVTPIVSVPEPVRPMIALPILIIILAKYRAFRRDGWELL